MKKFGLSLGLGFVVNNLVATLVAMAILNPLLNTHFNGMVRSKEEGLAMPALLGGYFILTLLMVIGYRFFLVKANWVKKGLMYGFLIGGIIFVSGHLIVAGWATIPPKPMLISGIFDTLATAATGLIIAFIYRNE